MLPLLVAMTVISPSIREAAHKACAVSTEKYPDEDILWLSDGAPIGFSLIVRPDGGIAILVDEVSVRRVCQGGTEDLLRELAK
jgi:hypothetical protein